MEQAFATRHQSVAMAGTSMEIKTYINWINSVLHRKGIVVTNLLHDLNDGVVLMNLGQELSGKQAPKFYSNPGMRVKKMENVNMALKFFVSIGVVLHNIGAEAIVDNDETSTLGMIWQLIHHFRIKSIHFVVSSAQQESASVVRGEEALMRWCQASSTNSDVAITNFTSSWKDGLALCSILENYFPNEVDWRALSDPSTSPETRLSKVFSFLETTLQVPPLLDPHDIASEDAKINARSMMLYLAMLQSAIKTRIDALKSDDERKHELDFVKAKLAEERAELEKRLTQSSSPMNQSADDQQAILQQLADIQTKLQGTEEEKQIMLNRLQAQAAEKEQLAATLQLEAAEKVRLAQILHGEATEKNRLAVDLSASVQERQHLAETLADTAHRAEELSKQLEEEAVQSQLLHVRLQHEAEERTKLSAQLEMTADEKLQLEMKRRELESTLSHEAEEKNRLETLKNRLQQDLSQNDQVIKAMESSATKIRQQLKEEEEKRQLFEEESKKLTSELDEMRQRFANESNNAEKQLSEYENKIRQMATMLQREHEQVTALQLARNKAIEDLQAMKKGMREMGQRVQEYRVSVQKGSIQLCGSSNTFDCSPYVGPPPPVTVDYSASVSPRTIARRRAWFLYKYLSSYSKLYDSPDTLQREGWLTKESITQRGRFDRRYFRLKGFELVYYKDPNEKDPRKVIDLTESILIPSQPDLPSAFGLISPIHHNRRFVIVAASDKDRDDWVRLIQDKIGCATYIKNCQMQGQEPDARVLMFYGHEESSQLRLEYVPNPLLVLTAISLPLQRRTDLEVVSLEGCGLGDIEAETLCRALSLSKSCVCLCCDTMRFTLMAVESLDRC